MDSWKKTSEELPPDGEQILFYDYRSDYYIGYYDEVDMMFIQDVNDGVPYMVNIENCIYWRYIPQINV